MNRILHRTFDGLIPRQEPSGLPENAAQLAQDVDLRRGVLTPVLGRAPDTLEGATGLGTTAKTLYLWRYRDWTLTTPVLFRYDWTLTTPFNHTAWDWVYGYEMWASRGNLGRFKITVGGTVYTCAPSLAACTSMHDVAAALQASVRAQTKTGERVVWVSETEELGHFVFYANVEIKDIAPGSNSDINDLGIAQYLCGPGLPAHTAGATIAWGTARTDFGSEWAALAALGKFKITVDGTTYTCAPNLTACVTRDQVAAAFQVALRAQTGGVERVVYVPSTTVEGGQFVFYANAEIADLAAPATGTNLAGAAYLNGAGTPATVEGEKWLHWDQDVNVVNSPVNDDAYSRVYYTGDGLPKMRLRMAGADVARDIKIEVPETVAVSATIYPTPVATSEVREKFKITGMRLVWYGAANGECGFGFTQTGDTLVIPATAIQYVSGIGSSTSRFDVLVNGEWHTTASVSSVDNLHRMVMDYSGITWIGGRWKGNAGLFRFSGSVKLTYTTNDGTSLEEAADNSKAISYVTAFVTDIGEVGPLSSPSEVLLVNPDDPVTLGASGTLPAPSDSTRGIVALRIYRASGGTFRFLADVPVTTSPYSYADTTVLVDDGLGEEAINDAANPPDDLEGLIACAGGWFAGFRGREFMASEPFIPTSWPAAYSNTVQAAIVALASTGNDTFIMTKGRPVMMSGSDPATLTAVNIESDQACVSAAGVVLLGQSVVYPSPDGLVSMYAGAAKVVTGEWYRREDWQALAPEGIRAAAHDGRYYAALTTLASPYMLIVDFGETVDRIATAAAEVQGLFADLLDDTLYAIEDGSVVVWRGGATPLQLDWRGREWLFQRPVSFGVLRVLASAYVAPVGDALDTRPLVTLYANGAEVASRRVTGPNAVRLPMLRPERRWSLRVQSCVEVTEINLATSMGALTS